MCPAESGAALEVLASQRCIFKRFIFLALSYNTLFQHLSTILWAVQVRQCVLNVNQFGLPSFTPSRTTLHLKPNTRNIQVKPSPKPTLRDPIIITIV
jgi:hypothetical protein